MKKPEDYKGHLIFITNHRPRGFDARVPDLFVGVVYHAETHRGAVKLAETAIDEHLTKMESYNAARDGKSEPHKN